MSKLVNYTIKRCCDTCAYYFVGDTDRDYNVVCGKTNKVIEPGELSGKDFPVWCPLKDVAEGSK